MNLLPVESGVGGKGGGERGRRERCQKGGKKVGEKGGGVWKREKETFIALPTRRDVWKEEGKGRERQREYTGKGAKARNLDRSK